MENRASYVLKKQSTSRYTWRQTKCDLYEYKTLFLQMEVIAVLSKGKINISSETFKEGYCSLHTHKRLYPPVSPTGLGARERYRWSRD
jgi:hypothetical protein